MLLLRDVCCARIILLRLFIINNKNSHTIYAHLSFLQDGEPVEYEVQEDENGRRSASTVTGPEGAFVQGRPMRTYREFGSRGGPPDHMFFGDDDDDSYGGSKY